MYIYKSEHLYLKIYATPIVTGEYLFLSLLLLLVLLSKKDASPLSTILRQSKHKISILDILMCLVCCTNSTSTYSTAIVGRKHTTIWI